jgi:hypothetical protein
LRAFEEELYVAVGKHNMVVSMLWQLVAGPPQAHDQQGWVSASMPYVLDSAGLDRTAQNDAETREEQF